MKQTNKTIKLRITRIAARTCGDYQDNRECLMATAARRQFKMQRSEVYAYAYSIKINDKHFQFSIDDTFKLAGAYKLGVIRPDFAPFTIDLIPVC